MRKIITALTLAWIAFLVAAQIWHCSTNRVPPAFDDAWYLEHSFRFYHLIRRAQLWEFIQQYTEAFRIKAPLISILPLPIYAALGPSVPAALLVNIAASLVTLWAVYKTAAILGGTAGGLMSAWICSTAPLLYGLPRQFLVEPSLTAVVAVTLWLLARSTARPIPAKSLGLLLGIGLLLKSLYLLYIAGPVFMYARSHWTRRAGETGHAEFIAAAKTYLAIGLGLASTWYAFNWMYALGFALSAGFGNIAKDYGGSPFLRPRILLDYWRQVATSGLGMPWFILGISALPGALIRRSGTCAGGTRAQWRLVEAGCLIPLALLSMGTNQDPRYAAPIIAPASIWIGCHVARLCGASPLRWCAPISAGIVSVCVFLGQTFGGTAPLPYNGPPSNRGDWGQGRVVERLREISRGRPITVAVGLEHAAFNANNMAALSALQDYPITFTSLGYAQKSLEAALIRIKEKNASCLILARGIPSRELPEFLNKTLKPLQERLDAGELPYKKIEDLYLGTGGMNGKVSHDAHPAPSQKSADSSITVTIYGKGPNCL